MDTASGETKKISFGFSKQLKKTPIVPTSLKVNEDVQLIDCLEGQSIKIVGGEPEEKGPLVIPMKQNRNLLQEKLQKDLENSVPVDNVIAAAKGVETKLSLDDLATQELIKEAQNSIKTEAGPIVSTIPLANNTLEGEPESTLDDYEQVPIKDFGLAMLRGMGWKETEGIGKNKAVIAPAVVNVRPRGMGLGADKMIKKNSESKNNEDLKFAKNAYVKINNGRHKDLNGQIQGFDDVSGTVIIKTTKGDIVSLNETFITLISKNEFEKAHKVINLQMIADYKRKEKDREEQASRSDRHDRSSKDEDYSRKSSKKSHKHRNRDRSSSEDSYDRKRSESRSKKKKKYRHRSRSRS